MHQEEDTYVEEVDTVLPCQEEASTSAALPGEAYHEGARGDTCQVGAHEEVHGPCEVAFQEVAFQEAQDEGLEPPSA